MNKQPELSVSDFFKFGDAAAAHTASLRLKSEKSEKPEDKVEADSASRN